VYLHRLEKEYTEVTEKGRNTETPKHRNTEILISSKARMDKKLKSWFLGVFGSFQRFGVQELKAGLSRYEKVLIPISVLTASFNEIYSRSNQ
jgi:hypothetical protein